MPYTVSCSVSLRVLVRSRSSWKTWKRPPRSAAFWLNCLLSRWKLCGPSFLRRARRWLVGSAEKPLDGLRRRWHPRSSPSTGVPEEPESACPTAACASPLRPGATGCTRGEVVDTRTTVLQMQTHQWVASFGNPGNGQSWEEWRRAKAALQTSIQAHRFPTECTLFRLDGPYGTGAVVSHLADCSSVPVGKTMPCVIAPTLASASRSPPEQGGKRDLPRPLRLSRSPPLPRGPLVCFIVATHPARTNKKKKRTIGFIRDAGISERVLITLPQRAFAASDVVSLSLHRGSFETALQDEDSEHEPDRRCRYSAW